MVILMQKCAYLIELKRFIKYLRSKNIYCFHFGGIFMGENFEKCCFWKKIILSRKRSFLKICDFVEKRSFLQISNQEKWSFLKSLICKNDLFFEKWFKNDLLPKPGFVLSGRKKHLPNNRFFCQINVGGASVCKEGQGPCRIFITINVKMEESEAM